MIIIEHQKNLFIDYAKACESIDRPSQWKILRHYGIPNKIVNIIKSKQAVKEV